MHSRRRFAQQLAALGAGGLTELAFAQRAAVRESAPPDTAWLNANENPDGPPPASIEAMTRILPGTGRYHYQEFRDFYATVARSEELEPRQVLIGAGSTEILHTAVDAFTGPDRPLIAMYPTFEAPITLTEAYGRPVVRVPLNDHYAADVRRLAAEAEKAKGGLLYLCNPNNPTSAITPKEDIDWLVRNLPPNTVALIDEAYIHFSDSPRLESAIRHVREGRSVIVSRTFSKIYGMAGLRAGFGCAREDLIGRMEPFRNNVISIVTVRAVLAALADRQAILAGRKARYGKIRADLCAWLRDHDVRYLEPHANFVMIDVGRDVRPVISDMVRKGVAPGRPFPPLVNHLRVSIGTEADMEKFRRVFWEVYRG